ncbi:MAG TPA: TRZ/ATZ family hydrolase [Casimicrobiaceae bacterium]|jgi:5-methylthioadenosine/S-adenosylhomocysteine deaminase
MTQDDAMRVDTRIDARWCVPIDRDGALEGHSLIVDRGHIVALVPAAEADARFVARERIDLATHVVMPGLVNAHTHAAMSLLRGIADDVPLDVWLREHIWPAEAAHVAPDFVFDGTLVAAAEMLAGGTTTAVDMYFHPEAAARAYLSAGMRAVLGMPILDFPMAGAADADAHLARGLAARDVLKGVPQLGFALAPHAPYTVGDATWRKLVTLAREIDLPIITHLQETRAERDDALARDGLTPLARLDRLGATGPGFVAVHAVHPGEGDLEILARQGCHVVHCPASNLKLGAGIAPVAEYVAAGINVALGTDGAASNNRLDMFDAMRLAALLAKGAHGDPTRLPAMSVLRMATQNGADAFGLGAAIGSLAPGKLADVIAIDLGGVATEPCYDPISQIVYAAGREHVTDVFVAGERVVAARVPARIDVAAIRLRARQWGARLASPRP